MKIKLKPWLAIGILLLLLNISLNAFSQCWTQPPIAISTDPDNYQNPEDPTGALKWDWRQQTWFGYRQGEYIRGTKDTHVVQNQR
jgi:hypothetical protein